MSCRDVGSLRVGDIEVARNLARLAEVFLNGIFSRSSNRPWPELAVKALQSVRVYQLVSAMAVLGAMAAVDLQAQVGISSGVLGVALVVRAPLHVALPDISHKRIGDGGDFSEAAVRIHVPASSGYRVVARSNPGTVSRVWIYVADDHYQELTPGEAVTLPGGPRGSSEREVRYLTERNNSIEAPLHFDLVIDPMI